jgi:pre-rRNA-processing protein TSR2
MDPRSNPAAGTSQLAEAAKEAFEEGVGLIFSQWTALCLAVENEWGGPMSRDKADLLIDDIIQWFYKKRGEHQGHAAHPAERLKEEPSTED